MSDRIYLDYAAATPMHPSVLEAMQPYFFDQFVNPSAAYQRGIEASEQLELARADVASVLGVHPRTIIFTAGATESIQIAIAGIMQKHPGKKMLTSGVEHAAVLGAATKYDAEQVPVDKFGVVKFNSLKEMIDDSTVLISVMYANNEVGSIQPIAEIAQLISEVRQQRQKQGNQTPLFLHSDASQAASYLHLNIKRLGVDLLSLNGAKMYGPKQSGALYINPDLQLEPLFVGGGQERDLRPGTESLAQSAGLAAALKRVQAARKDEVHRIAGLRDTLQKKLITALPQLQINGFQKRRLPNNLNISLPGIDGERVLMELDEAGLEVATGSACSASSDEDSHVLLAMGKTPQEASGSLRISLGEPTTEAEILTAAETLISVLQKTSNQNS